MEEHRSKEHGSKEYGSKKHGSEERKEGKDTYKDNGDRWYDLIKQGKTGGDIFHTLHLDSPMPLVDEKHRSKEHKSKKHESKEHGSKKHGSKEHGSKEHGPKKHGSEEIKEDKNRNEDIFHGFSLDSPLVASMGQQESKEGKECAFSRDCWVST